MESSQTTLLKEKLFPLIWSRSVEIYKKKADWKYLFQWSKHSYTTQFLELELGVTPTSMARLDRNFLCKPHAWCD
jgi:hypothetical protein